jgi:O-acetyl-ADP-ribose deacetylase (regulator of RNase III)
MPVEFVQGDMFDSGADYLVNTVNCVGAMGKGVALQFKKRHPEMYQEYCKQCARGEVQPGQLYVYRANQYNIINFPTKRHWRNPSRIEDIEAGLKSLRKFLETKPMESIAIPPLGCGNGGLDWNYIGKRIYECLNDLECRVLVYGKRPKTLEINKMEQSNKVFYAGIGSRGTPPKILEEMKRIGKFFAKAGMILRSGAADGADTAFEEGCDEVGGLKEIYIPWDGFNHRYSKENGVYTPEFSEELERIAALYHPAWERCSQPVKELHMRNVCQVLGLDFDKPSAFVVCWHQGSGGTLQACRIAEAHDIPVFNLADEDGREYLRKIFQKILKGRKNEQ